jgi:hypothetical protein
LLPRIADPCPKDERGFASPTGNLRFLESVGSGPSGPLQLLPPKPAYADEAIVAGRKAQRHNPSLPVAYRCLASAFAHLGRDAEAREAAMRVLELDPAFTVFPLIAWGGQARAKLFIEGLRKAGLPE